MVAGASYYLFLVLLNVNMWRIIKRRRLRSARPSAVTKHYLEHKELARELTLARLHHFNQHYGFTWNRVAIRNQRTCWGSCTSLKNLNFSYKIIFLPSHLQDYLIVHELCHLAELNHSPRFWNKVAETLPDYNLYKKELQRLEKNFHAPGWHFKYRVEDLGIPGEMLSLPTVGTIEKA